MIASELLTLLKSSMLISTEQRLAGLLVHLLQHPLVQQLQYLLVQLLQHIHLRRLQRLPSTTMHLTYSSLAMTKQTFIRS